MTFTPTLQSQIVNIMTIDNDIFEANQRICLRLTEPYPNSVIVGNDTEVVIVEDEGKFAIYVFIIINFLFSYSCSVYITMLY